MMTPLVSVVTICYNAEKDLEKTILSVLSQTYIDIEYIIIDGGSTDGTIDIIKKYSERLFYWVSEPDKGIYDAMNKGIDRSTGCWINFMNAGDVFYSEYTVESVFRNRDLSSIHLIYGDCWVLTGERMTYQKASPLFKLNYQMICCHQSMFVLKVGLMFRTDLRIASDYDLVLSYRKGFGYKSFLYVNIPISVFDATGISSSNTDLLRKEYSMIYWENRNPYYYYDLLKRKIKSFLC